MSKRCVLWDGMSGFVDIGGNEHDVDSVHATWPFSKFGPVMLEYAGAMVEGISPLDVLRENYGVDDALADEEAVERIAALMANPQEKDADALAVLDIILGLGGEING